MELTPTEKKAFFINAMLIAYADGELEASERALLTRLMQKLDVSEQQTKAWQSDLFSGQIAYQPIDDRSHAHRMLQIAVGMIAADGRLDPKERSALIHLSKALGYDFDALQKVYYDTWGKDAFAKAFPPPRQISIEGILMLSDHFAGFDDFVDKAKGLQFVRCTQQELQQRQIQTSHVIFHAAPQREETLRMVQVITRRCPDALKIAVLNRHQAPQVSYVLEAGIDRCMIEEVYPGELNRLLEVMKTSPRDEALNSNRSS